eukprot:m.83865 g.83865  ORF g.83865 m.83865 type:complete len:539 (+) comp12730_c0_seq2:2317-3933(+)
MNCNRAAIISPLKFPSPLFWLFEIAQPYFCNETHRIAAMSIYDVTIHTQVHVMAREYDNLFLALAAQFATPGGKELTTSGTAPPKFDLMGGCVTTTSTNGSAGRGAEQASAVWSSKVVSCRTLKALLASCTPQPAQMIQGAKKPKVMVNTRVNKGEQQHSAHRKSKSDTHDQAAQQQTKAGSHPHAKPDRRGAVHTLSPPSSHQSRIARSQSTAGNKHDGSQKMKPSQSHGPAPEVVAAHWLSACTHGTATPTTPTAHHETITPMSGSHDSHRDRDLEKFGAQLLDMSLEGVRQVAQIVGERVDHEALCVLVLDSLAQAPFSFATDTTKQRMILLLQGALLPFLRQFASQPPSRTLAHALTSASAPNPHPFVAGLFEPMASDPNLCSATATMLINAVHHLRLEFALVLSQAWRLVPSLVEQLNATHFSLLSTLLFTPAPNTPAHPLPPSAATSVAGSFLGAGTGVVDEHLLIEAAVMLCDVVARASTHSKSLPFGKLLLAIAQGFAPKLQPHQVSSLRATTELTKSFLKRKILAELSQ